MSLREAAQQALEALEQIRTPLRINTALDAYDVSRAISALRTALAEPENPRPYIRGSNEGTHWCALAAQRTEPEKEPVAWYDSISGWTDFTSYKPHRKPSSPSAKWIPLYTHPVPQPVELTDDDLEDIAIAARKGNLTDLRNAIERAQGIGGEA